MSRLYDFPLFGSAMTALNSARGFPPREWRPCGAFIKDFRRAAVGSLWSGEIARPLRRTPGETGLDEIREEPEDPTAVAIYVHNRMAFVRRNPIERAHRLRDLPQGVHGALRVQVIVHRLPEGGLGAGHEPTRLPARSAPASVPRGGDRRAHRGPFNLGPGESRLVVLDVLAVVGLQETEPDDLAGVVPQDLPDRHEVPEALRHLLPLQGEEAVVHPRPRPFGAPGPFADHRLALVVREHEIEPAAVDVERGAEVLVRHRVAFDVPTGAALPPRARPRGFVLLGPFPEGEVERILPAAPRGDRVHDDVLDLPMGEDAEGMFRLLRPEVDLAVDRVCVAAVDEPLHEGDDLGDVLGDLRIMGRGLDVQGAHVTEERIDEELGEIEGRLPRFGSPADDHLFDVREVLHADDPVPQELEVPPCDVERDVRACMAEVAEVVRGGAADVHLHDARSEGHERILPPRARVVQSKRHDGCKRGHRARSIKALARGRRPSLLRDTIRSIRRNLYAACRCARRRGPIDQRKIAAFARRKPWVQIPLGPYFPSTETRPTPT